MEPPAATATTAVLNHSNSYADSANSSPRSRTTETWEDHQAPPPARLRLMCSYGGHIVPRPHDKSLCYVGGETRIVVADRSSSLSDLRARLSKTLLGGGGFALKYQLPSEDLDSLISVTTDEDLDNMLDEYDRSRPNRLRLFLFSSSSSASSSAADDDWFVTALNAGGSSPAPPTASVNCLLGLDDDDAAPISASAPEIPPPPPPQRRIQEVQSVPDSPMLETTSSFGSTSSSPSLANLPPIRLHADSAADHFSQITGSSSAAGIIINNDGGGGGGIGAGFIALSSPPADFDDDRSDHGGALPIGYRKQQQQQQQKSTAVLDLPSPDSVSSDSSFGRAKPQFHDPNLQIPINNNNMKTSNNISDPNSVYVLQQQQQQQPPPPEFLQHHHHPPAAYYQPVYTSQQFPVYYIPARPSTQQQQQQQQQQTHYVHQSDASPVQVQRVNPAPPPPPQQQHYIGYSPVHHQPVSAATAVSYVYDYAADPASHHRHHQPQVYYAAPPQPPMASQYHTVPAPDPDTLKQMRTSQPL